MPRILADAQVLPIWEGTTNVLSLDTLRALGKGGALEAIVAEVETCCAAATDAGLAKPVEAALARIAERHGSPRGGLLNQADQRRRILQLVESRLDLGQGPADDFELLPLVGFGIAFLEAVRYEHPHAFVDEAG